MSDCEPVLKRAKLQRDELEKFDKEELIKKLFEYETRINSLEEKGSIVDSEELTGLRESEEKLKQQQIEATRRENVLVMRLTTKEQELQEYANQIQDLKQGQTPSLAQLRAMLLDPAVNLLFKQLKKQSDDFKAKYEEAQGELSAWKFTPDSQTGKRLMAKCRLLYQENEELGKQISSGRIAKLEGDLALQKNFSEEMKKSQQELDEFLLELDEDVEGMQSTIYFFKQQLQEVQEQLTRSQTEKLELQKELDSINVVGNIAVKHELNMKMESSGDSDHKHQNNFDANLRANDVSENVTTNIIDRENNLRIPQGVRTSPVLVVKPSTGGEAENVVTGDVVGLDIGDSGNNKNVNVSREEVLPATSVKMEAPSSLNSHSGKSENVEDDSSTLCAINSSQNLHAAETRTSLTDPENCAQTSNESLIFGHQVARLSTASVEHHIAHVSPMLEEQISSSNQQTVIIQQTSRRSPLLGPSRKSGSPSFELRTATKSPLKFFDLVQNSEDGTALQHNNSTTETIGYRTAVPGEHPVESKHLHNTDTKTTNEFVEGEQIDNSNFLEFFPLEQQQTSVQSAKSAAPEETTDVVLEPVSVKRRILNAVRKKSNCDVLSNSLLEVSGERDAVQNKHTERGSHLDARENRTTQLPCKEFTADAVNKLDNSTECANGVATRNSGTSLHMETN